MQIPKKKSKKIPIIISIIIAVLIVAGLVWWFVLKPQTESVANANKTRPENTVDYSPPTDEEKSGSGSVKENPDSKPTADSPEGEIDFNVSITRVSATTQQVVVGTLVNGASEGNCTIRFTQTGQPTVTASSIVKSENNSYTCGLITAPTSEFPAKGEWLASLEVTSKGTTKTFSWETPVDIP